LNRVSFLRPDHTFLSSALRHPSATFILFKNIEPLVQSPTSLARVSYADVEPILGKDIFNTTEEDVIAQYNSSLYIPQIVFLGLDERKEGFVYKEHYKGQPWFAVDVTPKESVKEEAEKLIEKLQSRGLDFSKGRMHLSLVAEEGSSSLVHTQTSTKTPCSPHSSRHLRRSPPPPRLERAKPLLRLLRLQNPLRQRRLQTHLPAQGHRLAS
jgi:hypothetical protein